VARFVCGRGETPLLGGFLYLLRRLGSQFERVFDVVGGWVLLGKGGWWKFECVMDFESFVKVGFTATQV
jgi:hypothetical protein